MDLWNVETKSEISVYPSCPFVKHTEKTMDERKCTVTGALGFINGARGLQILETKRKK